MTTFSDPAHMFLQLIISPQSLVFAGSCSGGPEKEKYAVRSFASVVGEHLFLDRPEIRQTGQLGSRDVDTGSVSSLITMAYANLSERKSSL